MADKEVVFKIEQRLRARAGSFEDIVASACASMQNFDGDELRAALSRALEWLAKDMREVADMREQAKAKGALGAAKSDRAVAGALQLLAIELAKAPAAEYPAPKPKTDEVELPSVVPAEPCSKAYGPDREEHPPHNWIQGYEGSTREVHCRGWAPRDLSGLDALIANRSGHTPPGDFKAGQPLSTEAHTQLVEQLGVDRVIIDDSVRAGEGVVRPLGDYPNATFGEGPVFMDPDPAEPPPAAAAAFTDPTGPGSREIPGPRVSWEQLGEYMGAPLEALGLPEHLSHSQIDTLQDCGTKYLLQRSETLDVIEVPQWALIGGNAFHKAIEWFELIAAEVKKPQFVKDRLGARGGVAALWSDSLGDVITETALANPDVPQDMWRASKKGLEGYTWWLVEGEGMVRRYVEQRMLELETPWRAVRRALRLSGEGILQEQRLSPMVEHEYLFDVDGVPFKGVIDQVWDITGPTRDIPDARAGDILIDDAKSGAKVPGDTGQLGEYALWLINDRDRSQTLPGKIWGRFYDARKGTYSEPVDLLERHPWERFAFEVKAADATKRAGVFQPRPSTFCGGCSVKHACPIFATRESA